MQLRPMGTEFRSSCATVRGWIRRAVGIPWFSRDTAVPDNSRWLKLWLDHGYVFVTAALRGGPEISPADESAGLFGGRKKNYEDMLAAARFLVSEGWTQKGRLFLTGASNGGLLVLRTALAEPDLFGAVYARSPVTDMLRFVDLDSSGLYWATRDYGYPAGDAKIFQFWLDNGPLAMAMKGQRLPPILLVTAMGDTTVNPAHSFKMLQVLRDNNTGGPFLLYVGPASWQHYVTNLAQSLEEMNYELAFFETVGKHP